MFADEKGLVVRAFRKLINDSQDPDCVCGFESPRRPSDAEAKEIICQVAAKKGRAMCVNQSVEQGGRGIVGARATAGAHADRMNRGRVHPHSALYRLRISDTPDRKRPRAIR